jgi:5-hydroxyisourate hydrolase-like protein (transthyretin family)
MALRPLVRIGLVIVAVAATGAVVSAPANADDPPTTGSVTGHYTQADQPVGPGRVTLMTTDYGFAGSADLGADGAFEIADVPPGQYFLSFLDLAESRTQFYHAQSELLRADPLTVTAGVATVIEEEMLPTGVLRGHLSHADGSPAAGVPVQLIAVPGGGGTAGITDAAGDWELHPFADVDYRVSFTIFDPNSGRSVQQFIPHVLSESNAPTFPSLGGEVTILDETLLPTGAIAGTFTGDNGSPVAGGFVSLFDLEGNFVTNRQTETDGSYVFSPVFAGQYKMNFADSEGNRSQWTHAKTDQSLADPITVTDSATTTVDEQLIALGSVEVHARDLDTGTPLADFCTFTVVGATVCSNGTGVITVADLPSGPRFVTVFTQDGRYLENSVTVTVPGGSGTVVQVSLQRAATISTTVQDRSTGAPVSNVCVSLVPSDNANVLGNTAQVFCSDDAGTLAMSLVTPGSYRLFADAQDGVHGDQWVGTAAGGGIMDQAALVTARAGVVTQAPVIRLDGAGKITGKITDAVRRAPLAKAVTAYTAFQRGFGGGLGPAVDRLGVYTYEDLGPYLWVLFYSEPDHASQYTGGVTNRQLAQGIQVQVGQTTLANVALSAGNTISGPVIGPDGMPVDVAIITAYNAITGDVMDDGELVNGRYTVHLLAPQPVKLQYHAAVGGGVEYAGWYPNAATFQQASTITLTVGNSPLIVITANRPAP